MREIIRTIIVAALAAVLTSAPVYAFDKDSVIDDARPGRLIIDYKDDIAGSDPVAGAEFTIFAVARTGPFGQPVPIIDNITLDASATGQSILTEVLAAYDRGLDDGLKQTLATDKDGIAVFEGLRHGMYLVMETKAAERHLPSDPVLVSVPYTEKYMEKNALGEDVTYSYWEYEAEVFPKPHKTGELVIKKTVQGNGGDKGKDFHFTVRIDAGGEFIFTHSGGGTGKIKSGDLLALKDGESVKIEGIPLGCSYSVSENEANQDGYRTEAKGTSGKIKYKDAQTAAFVNTKDAPTPTPHREITPTPPDYSSPPSVRTGDTRAVVVWVLAIAVGIVLFAASAGKPDKPKKKSKGGK